MFGAPSRATAKKRRRRRCEECGLTVVASTESTAWCDTGLEGGGRMRGVSKGLGLASIVAVLTMLAAPAAFAADRDDREFGRKSFERAKRFVVIVFSRFGTPPG